jgi:hypothetical protein
LKDFKFSEKDIKTISNVLGVEAIKRAENYRLVLENPNEKRKRSLEIYPDIPIGNETGNLISIYTMNSHIQLHFCTGYVPSESLGEVIFIGEHEDRVSGVIVEKEVGCSFYANVQKNILSGDFTKLAPEVVLSGIALSVAEHLIPDEN